MQHHIMVFQKCVVGRYFYERRSLYTPHSSSPWFYYIYENMKTKNSLKLLLCCCVLAFFLLSTIIIVTTKQKWTNRLKLSMLRRTEYSEEDLKSKTTTILSEGKQNSNKQINYHSSEKWIYQSYLLELSWVNLF